MIDDIESAVEDYAAILRIDPNYPLDEIKFLYPLYEERYIVPLESED